MMFQKEIPNPTAADYRREIIISFPNTFQGKKDDPQLLEKLSSKEELSGIFNVLMKALRRILKDKRLFLNEKTIEERMLKHQRAVNPVKSFIDEAVAEDSIMSDHIIKSEIYDAFLKYCNNYSIPPKSIEAFGKDLKNIGWKERKVSKDGKRPTVWFEVLCCMIPFWKYI